MPKIANFFCVIFFCAFCLTTNGEPLSTKNEQFYSSQNNLFKDGFSELIWRYIRQTNLTEQNFCFNRLKAVLHDLDEQKSYAKNLLKVSGGFPTVFEDATYASLGDYDKCFEVQIPDTGSRSTQYCVLSLAPDKERIKTDIGLSNDDLDRLYPAEFSERGGIDLTIGTCFPSSCSSQEISEIVKEAIKGVYWKHNRPIYCEKRLTFFQQFIRANLAQKVCLIGLVFWLSLVCAAGYYDFKNRGQSNEELSNSILYYFSPAKSFQELTRPLEETRYVAKDRQQLYIFMIVYQFHLFIWPFILRTSSVFANHSALRKAGESIFFQPMICGWISEFMLIVGGRSTIINFTTSVKNMSKFREYFILSVVRLLRYQLVIFIVAAIDICLPFFGRGPFYGVYSQQQSEVCSKSFIYNLLHATYLLKPEQITINLTPLQCLFHTWTMSVEFPLYVLAGILVCIYSKNNSLGSKLLFAGMLTSYIYSLWNFVAKDIQLALVMYPFSIRDTLKFFDLHYIHPLNHFWGFFVMLTATLEASRLNLRIAKTDKTRWRIRMLEYLMYFNTFATCIVNTFHVPLTPTFKVFLHIYFFTPCVIWCILKVIVEKDRFIRTLSKVFLNTIPQDTNANLLNSESDQNSAKSEKKTKPNRALQDFQEKILPSLSRLAKAAFFPHASFIFWYLISLKQPLVAMSASFMFHLTVMYVGVFIVGGFFFILVLNPCEKMFRDLRKSYILPLLEGSRSNAVMNRSNNLSNAGPMSLLLSTKSC